MRKRAVVLAIILVLTGCATAGTENGGESETTPGPPTATPTTAVVATTSEAASTTTVDEWDALPVWRGGPAGEYRSGTFEVPVRFTTPSTYTPGGGGTADFLGIAKPDFNGVYLGTHDTSVEETVAYYTGLDGVEITGQSETTIGGAPGVVLEGRALRLVITGTLADGSQFGWSEGTEFSLHIVDVGGQTVEVSVDRVPPVPPSFEEEAQAILDSIVWRDLEG